jgi:hypothetical protein
MCICLRLFRMRDGPPPRNPARVVCRLARFQGRCGGAGASMEIVGMYHSGEEDVRFPETPASTQPNKSCADWL